MPSAAQILFVHNNFPAQFAAIAADLVALGNDCYAIGSQTAVAQPGVQLWSWRSGRGSTPGLFDPATRAEADLIRARAAANCALALKEHGFNPSLIIGHPGWGETLFMREIFPKARQILHAEFFYGTSGGDVGFDPEAGALTWEERFRVIGKNATLSQAYLQADRLVAPTAFQRSRLPDLLARQAAIIHEGIDTDVIQPRAGAVFTLPNGRRLSRSTPTITYISRTLEPLRGFHIFMRALPAVLAQEPGAEVLVIGEAERAGYGPLPPAGTTWRDELLRELGGQLDVSRVHFLGRLTHAEMLDALAISAAHVYFTYPFVLSWSLLEAMASGCLVIASDTAPVRDAIVDGKSGFLMDFFDVQGLSARLAAVCRDPDRFTPLRAAARQAVVAGFDQTRICIPAWRALVNAELSQAGGSEASV